MKPRTPRVWEAVGFSFGIGWPPGFQPAADPKSNPGSDAALKTRKLGHARAHVWNGADKDHRGETEALAKAIKAGRPSDAAIEAQAKKWGRK